MMENMSENPRETLEQQLQSIMDSGGFGTPALAELKQKYEQLLTEIQDAAVTPEADPDPEMLEIQEQIMAARIGSSAYLKARQRYVELLQAQQPEQPGETMSREQMLQQLRAMVADGRADTNNFANLLTRLTRLNNGQG